MFHHSEKLNPCKCGSKEKPHVGSSACQRERENKLANKWIKELIEVGFTPNDMVAVFREARRKFEDYKKRKTEKQCQKY